MAWSRAQQAVTLLGRIGAPALVAAKEAGQSGYLTLAEICYALGLRNTRLAPELGRPDLFLEARRAATGAQRFGLAAMIDGIGRVQRVAAQERLQTLAELAQILPRNKDEIEPWLLVELGPQSKGWIEEVEAALSLGRNASVLL